MSEQARADYSEGWIDRGLKRGPTLAPGPYRLVSQGGYSHIIGTDEVLGELATIYGTSGQPYSPAMLATAKLFTASWDLREALKAMLDTHGKPHREEWLNDAAFEHAKAVDARARAALAQVEGQS